MTCCSDRPTALYRHFDETGILLYVGLSVNVPRRMREHSGKSWWFQTAKITIEWFDNGRIAHEAERAAICYERPIYNKRSNNERPARTPYQVRSTRRGMLSLWAYMTEQVPCSPTGFVQADDLELAGLLSSPVQSVGPYLKWLQKCGVISGYRKGRCGWQIEESHFDPLTDRRIGSQVHLPDL